MPRLALGLIVLTTLSGCLASPSSGPPSTTYQIEQTPAVAAAVFRHMFKHHADSTLQSVGAFFLTIEGKDPGDSFIKRFAEHLPPVRKGSAFASGKGLWLRVNSIKWIDSSKVEVFANCYQSRLLNWDRFYRVQKEWWSAWVVVDFALEAMDDEIDEGQ